MCYSLRMQLVLIPCSYTEKFPDQEECHKRRGSQSAAIHDAKGTRDVCPKENKPQTAKQETETRNKWT